MSSFATYFTVYAKIFVFFFLGLCAPRLSGCSVFQQKNTWDTKYYVTAYLTPDDATELNVLDALSSDDAVTRKAARLLGSGGCLARVAVHLELHGRQSSRNTAQLHLQRVGEVFHFDAAQLAVHDACQKPDDAPPLVVLSVDAGRKYANHLRLLLQCTYIQHNNPLERILKTKKEKNALRFQAFAF